MLHRMLSASLLLLPAVAFAQSPAVKPATGLKAAAASTLFERGGVRPSAPRYAAAAMRAPVAVETLPGLRFPNNPNTTATRELSLLQRVKPPFRLSEADASIPDAQDVIFFTEARIVRVRLHLKTAGEPLPSIWKKQLRKLFDFHDRDGDGVLNGYEAEFVFSNASVQQMLQNGSSFIRGAEMGRSLADFDRDCDGKISFDEFVAYYAPSTQILLRVQPGSNRDLYADAMTDELFKLLDQDKDGRLSRSELEDLEKLLAALDQNEDECLAALELAPNLFTRGGFGRPVGMPMQTGPANPTIQPLQIYRTGAIPESIAEQILTRYDKDKNLRLSFAETGLDDKTFKRLDRNGDGDLAINELLAWRDLPPDAIFELTLGAAPSESSVKPLPGPDGKPSPLADQVKLDEAKAVLYVGRQRLDIGVPATAATQIVNFGRTYQFIFDQADPQNRGYVTEQDLAGPQFQTLRIAFDAADRDGDGKLTRKEYSNYYEVQAGFYGLPIALNHLSQAPSLFGLLDANGDGRLGIREIRTAWDRLRSYEPGNGEYITRAAIQPQVSLRLTRFNQSFQAFGVNVYNPVVQAPTRGPLWFRKMDRNGDGDVSRAEFPGKSEDFDKLDLDKDGLISLEEAEAADRKLRGEKK